MIVEALLYILVAGCQWRNLPLEFLPWQTVQRWFYRWRDDGTLELMHHAMLALARERASLERKTAQCPMLSDARPEFSDP